MGRCCAVGSVARLVLALNVLIAPICFAQGTATFRPSITVTQVHDSNLFFTPGSGESDFITRLTPAVDAQYRSPIWTLSGRYALDAERFIEHLDLNRGLARQQALAAIDYRRSARTRMAISGAFSTTRTPAELMRETGLGFVRASAQRVEGTWSMMRQISARTGATLGYSFNEDRIEAGPSIRTQALTVAADKRLSERSRLSSGYRVRQFMFGATPVFSHAVSVGWSHAINARATMTLSGGPNLTDETPGVDVEAGVRARLHTVDIGLSYAQSQTTVFGLPDVVQTQSVGALLAWAPARSIQLRFAPAAYRSRRDEFQVDVVRATAAVVYSIKPNVAIEVAVDGSDQRGLLFAGMPNQRIPRYETTIRLVAGSSSR